MKPIRILSPELDLLAEIDNYENLQLTRGYYFPGEVSISINRHKQNTEYLEKDNIIIPAGELHKAYIIRHKEIQVAEDGKITENWDIRGNELAKVTNRRTVIPPDTQEFDSIDDYHETAMRRYIDNHLINPDDVDREISQLVLENTDSQLGSQELWEGRFDQLDELLEEIAKDGEMGWRIALDYDNLQWVFEVYQGKDRTKDNTEENEPVILSPAFDSIRQLVYTDSDLRFRNFAFVGGDGEGADRLVEEVEEGNPTGLDRRETFINESQIEESDKLKSVGKRELREMSTEKTLEGELLGKSPFQYEQDFDLGDKITIQNQDWNIRLDTRIVEITETYSRGGKELDAVFGEKRPTLTDVIENEFKNLEGEIRK